MKRVFIIIFICFQTKGQLFCQSSDSTKQLLNILKISDIGTNAVKYSIEMAKYDSDKNQTLANDIITSHPNLPQFNKDFQKTKSNVKAQSDRDKIIFNSVEFGNSVIMAPVYEVPIFGSTNQLLNILKNSDIGTNAVKYSVEMAKFASDNNQNLANDIITSHPNLPQFNKDFQKTISNVKAQSDRDKVIFKSVEFGNSVIMAPVYEVPIFGSIMKETNNQIFDAAEKDLQSNYEKKLAYSLGKIREKDQKIFENIINTKDYNTIKNALDDVNFFSDKSYSNLAPEFQQVIEKSQQKFLQFSVNSTLKKILDDVGSQQINIEEVNEKVGSLTQFTYKFAEESNKRFDNLVVAQEELNNKVDKFYTEYQQDKKAVDFMQDFMYSKMNTSEKIRALEGGLFPGIPDYERIKLKEELDIIQQREKVINSAQDFLNTAGISLKIAKDLGLGDSPLVKDLSTAINYGQAAFGAVTSFMSGNYLQAISSVTGMFGGGGPDIAEQRHEQILERFKKIDQKLDVIDKKLDVLIEGQKNIIKNQEKTFDFLITLSKNIDDQHIEIMKEFKTVENEIYVNRELITNEWEKKCESCLEIIKKRLKMDLDKDILPDYGVLRQEFVNISTGAGGGPLSNCENYVAGYRFSLSNKKVNPDFYTSSKINGIKNAQKLNDLIKINEQAFNLLFESEYFKKETDKNKILASCFFPSNSLEELENKINAKEIKLNSTIYNTDINSYINLLWPQAIERHGFIIRNMNFVFNLTDGKNLLNWKSFENDNLLTKNLNLELGEAIQLNNISIAQQTILAGDIFLPILFNILEVNKKEAEVTISKDILGKNSILATNFVNYYFFKKIKNNSILPSQYSYLYNTKDSTFFNKNILPVFPVTYIDSLDVRIKTFNIKPGWFMIINDLPYKIPSPNETGSTTLVQTESLAMLIQNRNELFKQQKTTSIYKGLTIDQKMNINYLILKTQY